MVAQSPFRVRSAALRRSAFSLEKASLRSSAPQRVEVRRVGRQEQHGCAGSLNGPAGFMSFVGRQVIQDDGVARAQRWAEDLLDIGLEGLCGHGSVEQHGCGQACETEACHKGCGLPMPMRHTRAQALATRGTTPQSGHLGTGAGFIDEHQAQGIEIRLAVKPGCASRGDIRPILFGGVRGFF
jgi:hypothetical protein